jgi:DNA repair exonuclease SbcCD ATPase subunit
VVIILKNFETHKTAEIDVEGITVLEGENYSGKSSVVRAFEAALKNEVPLARDKDVPKWNRDFDPKNPFVVQILDGALEGRPVLDLAFSYKKYVLNGETRSTGKDKLYNVFPEFPYKVVDFGDSVYYNPHVISQGETPVFSSLDVFTFFSSLFDKISLLGDALEDSKKKVRDIKKAFTDSEAVLSEYKGELLVKEKQMSEYNVPVLERLESLLSRQETLSQEITSLKKEQGTLQEEVSKYSRYVLLARTDLVSMAKKGRAMETLIDLLKTQEASRKQASTLLEMYKIKKRMDSILKCYDFFCLFYRQIAKVNTLKYIVEKKVRGDACLEALSVGEGKRQSVIAIARLEAEKERIEEVLSSVSDCPLCGQSLKLSAHGSALEMLRG